MERYIIHDGGMDIRITEWGSKNHPVIFCLHGLGSTSLSFIEVAEKVKNQFRVISIDAPGHGKSSPFDDPRKYEMPAMAAWLNQIINILEIDRFYFLSHSWGSFVALFYLLHNPAKVKGSILIDGGYQTKRLKEESLEDEVAFYLEDYEDFVDTWEEFLELDVYGDLRRSALLDVAAKDLALEKGGKFYWHTRGKTAGHIVRAMHKHETMDIYEKLPSNLVLLRATMPIERQEYRDLTSTIFEEKTGAEVKLISNATHMLHWDFPEIVAEEIREKWTNQTRKN
ncbi:alpha/beta fold hydrolase [Falsibacillus albus]|uniref:Alpha/beta hydrolase n=1 Tax=Falsibacillus albus TaxID=2478915 RepID=A0A3L7JVE5_9BACI|nr:alpha/beta hydrolase [Falsibacillus albus]RLQ92412.1 alpha/beta hydrolase [Falsibacillus albus]